uniref:JmjC domain-containing protein n=1 Tax=Calcidiscus leptoporus TaxID=127549 RepID=A0A7S0IZ20_9EUKA
MAGDGFNWTQLSMSRAGNFPPGGYKQYTAEQVREKGAMWVWHTTFARSIPAVITGLAQELSDELSTWDVDTMRRKWGQKDVMVAFSPDKYFQRGWLIDNKTGRRLRAPHRQRMLVDSYLDEVLAGRQDEHIAVQQSPHRDLSEFGLPNSPPLLEDLVKPTLQATNLWVATPPKTSVLHYDWQDSVLLQLSGSKRFTVIDPARLHTAYPCVMQMESYVRVAPGVFETRIVDREIDNFPLVNVSHPDFERFPLFKDAHVMTIDVPAGAALILPAYWYHQVESFAEPGKFSVALNYWFQGHSLATRLYRTLRENVFLNCTLPAMPGELHPCRDSRLRD